LEGGVGDIVVVCRNLLYSGEDLAASLELLARFKVANESAGKERAAGERVLPEGVTDEALWRARRVKEAMVHPDTGLVVPPYLRWSAFVPSNMPIVAGMTLYGQRPATQLFFQFLNQTYNAAVNYGNRNATVEANTTELLTSYVAATSVACGVALGLGRVTKGLVSNERIAPWLRTLIGRTVPFTAVALAGSTNALMMRSKEALAGIDVYDPATGRKYGVSKRAGELALQQVALTRVVLPIPVMFLPPYLVEFTRAIPAVARAVAKSSAIGYAIEFTIIAACLTFALPTAIALFPQEATADAAQLEPEFHNLRDPVTGERIATLAFNKGT
jgi:sideroflexin-5